MAKSGAAGTREIQSQNPVPGQGRNEAGFRARGGPTGSDARGTPPDMRNSMPQGTAVGSGSRPGPGKTYTPSSAPENIRTLGGRGDVAGALGVNDGSAKPKGDSE